MEKNKQRATFAGGCFWCMVKPFDQWDGILEVTSGYTGGHVENPSYEEVKQGDTGHFEAVDILFDAHVISYEEILDVYWRQIDPTDDGGQFHDRGDAYRTAIFYHDQTQKQLAEQSRDELEASGRFTGPIVTEILPASTFYPAEEKHQDFYKKDRHYYEEDRAASGRDAFLQKAWQD